MRTMKTIFSLLVLVTLSLNSCKERCVKGSGNIERIERTVSTFSKIKLNGSLNLYIQQGSVQKVELLADDNILPLIKTDVAGETLTLGLKHHSCIRKSNRLDVYITIPAVTGISLNGSGNLYGEGVFTGEDIELSIIGSGNANFTFDGKNIRSNIEGSGDITVLGKTDYSRCVITGLGKINALGLHASIADAKITGSGKIELSVRDHLKVHISGSGDVFYYGTPSTDIAISGSGKVTKR